MSIEVKVETYQIVGDDMLRLDLSVHGTVDQDGKSLSLNHERQTVYVRKDRGDGPLHPYTERMRSDPRQKGRQ